MAIIHVALETWLLLRRHKIIVPMVIIFTVVCFVASLASGLVNYEFRKVLFDVAFFGFHLAGGVVAIFWGAKALSDSKQEGSLELQLASPISRVSWLIGKYVGLAWALLTLGVIFCGLLQVAMHVLDLGWMTFQELHALLLLCVVWLTLASLVVFFASFSGLPVAAFSCCALWLLGMTAPFFSRVSSDTPVVARTFALAIGRYWNLNYLNVGDTLYTANFPDTHEIYLRATYGLSLTVVVLMLAAVIFSRRDLVR